MNEEQIASRLDAHMTWLNNQFDDSGQRFVEDDVDFLRADWSNFSMSCAVLFGARFDECDLHSVDFFQADLPGASFKRANMTKSILSKTNIDGCVFNEALMQQVIAWKVICVDVDFVGATLTGADLRHSQFIQTDFSRATLAGANLEGVIFHDCKFCDSDLTGIEGLASVGSESKIVVGPSDSPIELRGDAAIKWIRSQIIQ